MPAAGGPDDVAVAGRGLGDSVQTLFGVRPRYVGMEHVVQLARRHLHLDFVSVTEIRGGNAILQACAGDETPPRIRPRASGTTAPTYGRLLVAGEIPSVITDTWADELVRDLPITRQSGVRAFIGVTLRRSDGSVYGALCGIGHVPDHTLDERDVHFLTRLAELLTPELDDRARREQFHRELTRLMDVRDGEIACQPIVEVRSGRCLGVEALARFPEPLGAPTQVFTAAYEVGLGLELEQMVVQKAWPLLAELQSDQFVAINFTPSALAQFAQQANARSDLRLDNLVVELTEHAVVENYDALRTELEPLRLRGLRVAIDDAGAGYASLRHVVELQPDIIKIDESLIQGIAGDHARRVAVSALLMLALDLGATVVAEGLDRAQDLEALSDIGVPAVQGFLIARPSTDRRQLARWLRGNAVARAPERDAAVRVPPSSPIGPSAARSQRSGEAIGTSWGRAHQAVWGSGVPVCDESHSHDNPCLRAYEARVAELERRLRRIAAEIRGLEPLAGSCGPVDLSGMPGAPGLSQREFEIVDRLLQGQRVPGIAREMYLSPSTVRNHLSAVFAKVGVHSQAELIAAMRRFAQ